MESANFTPENAGKFVCEFCDFKCYKQSDWNRHIMTSKHKRLTNANYFTPKDNAILECICGKMYKHASSLCKHKKICSDVNKYNLLQKNNTNETANDSESESETESKSDSESDNKKHSPDLSKKDNLIEYLINENKEFKNMIMELINKDYSSNTNNTNNTINNVNSNNSFNLNVFLNEKCKEAMNMSEFVDTIKMQLSDLENFAHVDYADGVSKILLKNLNKLDTYLRPIHCSDLKRETVYIKENDCWTKEDDDKPNLKKAIKQVAFKNIKQINEWVKENPGCQDPRTKQNVKYNKIVMNSMSGTTTEEQTDNIEKIMKNVTKAVTIDKYSVK